VDIDAPVVDDWVGDQCPDSQCPEHQDPFDRVVEEIIGLNRRKRADYTGNQDPWENFKDSSRQVGQAPGLSVEVLIGTKQSRLRQLLQPGREPNNESIRDTFLDRAVYAIIALAMYDEGLYQLDA